AGMALVLSGLMLCVIHTSPFRRFALSRIQAYLRENQGLLLKVGEFDYSLLSLKLELKDVALNALSSQDLPADFMAKHVVLVIPAWRAALGSLQDAQIWIDGLAINWTRLESGANWAVRPGGKDRSMFRFPTISAVNCEFNLRDR